MTTTREFLSTVLPTDAERYGYAITNGNHFSRKNAPSLDALASEIDAAIKTKTDVYFCGATFEPLHRGALTKDGKKDKTQQSDRYAASVCGHRVDLDAHSDGKSGYASVEAAKKALWEAVDNGLPVPTFILSTGNGIQAHWVVPPQPKEAWSTQAARLQRVCEAKGLKLDTTVSTDTVRVMRMPGSANTKRKAPDATGRCEIIHPSNGTRKTYTVEELDAHLDKLDAATRINNDLQAGLPGSLSGLGGQKLGAEGGWFQRLSDTKKLTELVRMLSALSAKDDQGYFESIDGGGQAAGGVGQYFKICKSAIDLVGEEAAAPYLDRFSQWKNGEVNGSQRASWDGGEAWRKRAPTLTSTTGGTLIYLAREAGYTPPADVIMDAEPDDPDFAWPEVEPFGVRDYTTADFPMKALPQIMRDAIEEYRDYGQQPVSMLVASAISAASLAGQSLANVARDDALVSPISMASLTVADSGGRKTAGDKEMSKGIKKVESAVLKAWDDVVAAREAEHFMWKQALEGVEEDIRTFTKRYKHTGNKSATQVRAQAISDLSIRCSVETNIQNPTDADIYQWLQSKLTTIKTDEPKTLVRGALRYGDVSKEALTRDINFGYPSTSLWDDEGGNVLGSVAASEENRRGFFARISKLWDGNPIPVNRMGREMERPEGERRCSVNLMIQPSLFCGLLEGSNRDARDTGTMARFLLTFPEPTTGKRKYKNPPTMARVDAFADLVGVVAQRAASEIVSAGTNELSPPILRLSDEAKSVWTNYYEHVERRIGPGESFSHVADWGSKSAEQAARLAALFCVLNRGGVITRDPNDEKYAVEVVSKEEMTQGVLTAAWFLSETARVVAEHGPKRHEITAKRLWEWIQRHAAKKDSRTITRREITREGPYAVRDDKRVRDTLLSVLVAHGYLVEKRVRGGKCFCLNPHAESQKT